MLRLPYLLSFLLCIELSFCYNYIDDDAERKINNLGHNLRRENFRRVRRPNVRRSPVHQEEDYDRSPVEFDVASFMQPEEENVEANEVFRRHRSNKRRWTPKQFDLGSMLKADDGNTKMEKAPDYMGMSDSAPELGMSPPMSKDLINAKHYGYPMDDVNAGKYGNQKFKNVYKEDMLVNQNGVHNQEKKCSLKTIKFPFFSHNKSQPLKPKKNKKRKLFFFSNPKKDMARIPDLNKMNEDSMIPYKMKRSYEQRLCPACKKIFVSTPEHDNARSKKHPRNNLIHNSRQFYQHTSPDATLKDEVKDYGSNKVTDGENRYRSKRQESERQLKELEAVQKKIDAVQIHLPRFEKPAEKKAKI